MFKPGKLYKCISVDDWVYIRNAPENPTIMVGTLCSNDSFMLLEIKSNKYSYDMKILYKDMVGYFTFYYPENIFKEVC